ncbi:MAG: YbaK/EbsC family protein [Ktedonobacterales bacterium]|nr:YbaK/EbsC family protein [Ktedonobacterales bacterium]
MKEAARRVEAALRAAGITAEIVEFSESTRTAAEAAAAVGTTVGQIVKSLVFVVRGQPVLALVSGAHRVDTARLAQVAGGPVTRADAATARAATGYAIGGVPPVGHTTALPIYLDRALLEYADVWAAAGTPNAVFNIAPATLLRITGATVADLAVTEG